MKLWRKRTFLAAAYGWRREVEAELQASIQIEERLLHSLRSELAELRQLDGVELCARFGWETPAEVEAAMRENREWADQVETVFCEAAAAGKW